MFIICYFTIIAGYCSSVAGNNRPGHPCNTVVAAKLAEIDFQIS